MLAPILVTGATGFLGRAIVSQAISGSIPLKTTGRKNLVEPLPNFVSVDLADETLSSAQLDELVAGTRCVIHAAGLAHQFDATAGDYTRFHRLNVDAPVQLAEAAARQGVKRFVHVSSIKVYNPSCPQPIHEQTPLDPIGPYAQSKAEAETKLFKVAERAGLEVVALRMAVIYGEEDGGNVARLISAIDRGRFVMVGRGENLKSLIYRGDAARACLAVASCAELPTSQRAYNIAADPVSMREIVETIYQALGRRRYRLHMPASCVQFPFATLARLRMPVVSRKAEKVSETLSKWLVDDAYDGALFRKDFHFQPQVSLASGIQNEVAWYRGQDRSRSKAA
ncbi:NAD-dependent epimerase/dehydratase family protein [Thalassoroseus pseudoceratinae]|uniref:NAD-dependent epimerase/dehydratase family protein n=1 Tax=Thalassoroseus pseudoceratinae TaxID=2713176 RepID=UPI00141FF1B5|nr:NAD-dependent epimerase/dehydratase family protein [Thalassoroseus pseudoceratinae]